MRGCGDERERPQPSGSQRARADRAEAENARLTADLAALNGNHDELAEYSLQLIAERDALRADNAHGSLPSLRRCEPRWRPSRRRKDRRALGSRARPRSRMTSSSRDVSTPQRQNDFALIRRTSEADAGQARRDRAIAERHEARGAGGTALAALRVLIARTEERDAALGQLYAVTVHPVTHAHLVVHMTSAEHRRLEGAVEHNGRLRAALRGLVDSVARHCDVCGAPATRVTHDREAGASLDLCDACTGTWPEPAEYPCAGVIRAALALLDGGNGGR